MQVFHTDQEIQKGLRVVTEENHGNGARFHKGQGEKGNAHETDAFMEPNDIKYK